MTEDEIGKQLHDRATRGGVLSPDEERRLDQWYSQRDAAESEALLSGGGDGDHAELRSAVRETLGRLADQAQRMQALEATNEALRRDIQSLRRRAATTAAAAT